MKYHKGVAFNNHIWEIKSHAQVDRMKTSSGLNCKSRRSTQIPTTKGQSQKMCSKVSTAAKYRGKQASERSRRLYRLEKLGMKLRNIRHV
ncbi:hypothetical protein Gogos_021770, partial [Gossypium gossypioides]|nr:hypothetical protein [Gossypium gossypioides]